MDLASAVDPKQTLTTSFSMPKLRGFGLMQRDRNFGSYEDSEARYELRPSAWIEPVGDWGPGRVELVQLHTPDETNDNIVAYWVPNTLPAKGQPLDFTYRLHWQGAQMQRPPGAWVTQTRVGRGYYELAENEHQFVVDFTGPSLAALAADATVKRSGHGAFQWPDSREQCVPRRGNRCLAHDGTGQAAASCGAHRAAWLPSAGQQRAH